MASESYLVAGLGNIGPEYALTRHNMGFITLDAWAQASGVVFETKRYGDVAQVHVKGRTFHLLKPSTYMNLSGNAVRYYMQALSIPLERCIVICDDINLPFGATRMRKSGSDGGHNGLKHIAQAVGSQDYARIRLGVGHDFAQGAQVDFVLGRLSEDELSQMPAIADRVIQGIKDWAFIGPERAMNSVNARQASLNQMQKDI